MKKETMLVYLDEQIDKKLNEFDIAIDWDKRNHTVEVMFRLFAENKNGEVIDDSAGVSSEEEIIEFEDGILFYNAQKNQLPPDPEDYLAVIAFDGKKGIRKSVIDGALLYLNEVLTEGQSDLLDFLTDSDQETFELNWDDTAFNQFVEQAKTIADDYLPYPSY